MGLIVLILICVVLAVASIWKLKQANDQEHAVAGRLTSLSNDLAQASTERDQQKQVNKEIEGTVSRQKETLVTLTNSLTETAANLEKSQASLKSAQDQLTQRDAKIADLESENRALDQRALELSTSITNLTAQIDDTKRKLAASEGDRAFLDKELQRLMSEKAELERQFNDLKILRAQVAKLKEEMNVSRRLAWIRKGLLASSEQKGAEQLMQKTTLAPASRQPAYDLNVEVSADGTVRVIPPLTNKPALK